MIEHFFPKGVTGVSDAAEIRVEKKSKKAR